MPLQAHSLLVCFFLTQVAANTDTGVRFLMDRHLDHYFCGHLKCDADFTHSRQDVLSLVEMIIYDITRVHTELKLASVTTFHPDLYVDTTRSSATSCTGVISRHKANLTVQLRHDIDCLYGVYKCQLRLVTVSGQSQVLTEIVIPEHNHIYSGIADVTGHLGRLTELLNSHTINTRNLTSRIDMLASGFEDKTIHITTVVNQSDDQRMQISRLAKQLDHHIFQLNILANKSDLQTNQISSMANELGHQTVQINRLTNQLDNQTAQMHGLSNQLDHQRDQLINQTTQVNRVASLLHNQTVELLDQTLQLNNLSGRLEHLIETEQKLLHEVIEEKLQKVEEKLDVVEKPPTQTATVSQEEKYAENGDSRLP